MTDAEAELARITHSLQILYESLAMTGRGYSHNHAPDADEGLEDCAGCWAESIERILGERSYGTSGYVGVRADVELPVVPSLKDAHDEEEQ